MKNGKNVLKLKPISELGNFKLLTLINNSILYILFIIFLLCLSNLNAKKNNNIGLGILLGEPLGLRFRYVYYLNNEKDNNISNSFIIGTDLDMEISGKTPKQFDMFLMNISRKSVTANFIFGYNINKLIDNLSLKIYSPVGFGFGTFAFFFDGIPFFVFHLGIGSEFVFSNFSVGIETGYDLICTHKELFYYPLLRISLLFYIF